MTAAGSAYGGHIGFVLFGTHYFTARLLNILSLNWKISTSANKTASMAKTINVICILLATKPMASSIGAPRIMDQSV